MTIFDIFKYGIILSLIEMVIIIISTWGLKNSDPVENMIKTVISKFVVLNIFIVGIISKFV